MARNLDPKCRRCRRAGEKLFLKGEKCFTPKCPIVRRNYAPGQHGQASGQRLSGYGLQLKEKQKAKKMYGVLERQLRNYYDKAINRAGNTGENFFRLLELRLDNVIFRMGFARSRDQARQIVNHGHIFVNEKKVDVPSFQTKAGDHISVRPVSQKSAYFQDLQKGISKTDLPKWLIRDEKKMTGQVAQQPTLEHFPTGIQMPLIIEYYSR